jgi:hypothetical protein
MGRAATEDGISHRSRRLTKIGQRHYNAKAQNRQGATRPAATKEGLATKERIDPSAASRNQSWIDHKERKDRKEETPLVLFSAFFVFFAVKMLLELHDSPG